LALAQVRIETSRCTDIVLEHGVVDIGAADFIWIRFPRPLPFKEDAPEIR
jgi:hypothetical protein